LWKGGDAAATFGGIVEDAATVANSSAPPTSRAAAAFSLATEIFSPVTARDAKAGAKIVRNVPRGGADDFAAAANPLEGARYTGKVRQQMRPHNRTAKPDNHGFPLEVDNLAGQGIKRQITGGDGVVRTKVELRGNYRDREGTFEWIIEPDSSVNHRLFVPDPK